MQRVALNTRAKRFDQLGMVTIRINREAPQTEMHMRHLLVIAGIGVIRGGPGRRPQHGHRLRRQLLAQHGRQTRRNARDQRIQLWSPVTASRVLRNAMSEPSS